MNDQSTDVFISKAGFAVCRYGVAGFVWYSVIDKTPYGVLAAFFILGISALLGVAISPLILLTVAVEKILKKESPKVPLFRKGIRFAHIAGTILSGSALLAWYFNPTTGWIITICFALLKSVSAIGLCPAERLYRCATSDSCCTFMKRWKK